MRKAIIISLAAGLMACASASAEPRWVPLIVKCQGAVTSSVSASVQGRIMEVRVSSPATNGVAITSVTGNVAIAATPAFGTGNAATTIYANTNVTSAVAARPRMAPTDTAGTGLSSLTVYEPYLCVGDTVALTVIQTGAASNVVWRADVKVD